MNRVDCHKFDEQLMDFLYEELDEREMGEFRSHVEGCPRCSAEIGRFQATRKAVSVLEQLEVPAAVSAKLLHQAASARRKPSWRQSRALRFGMVAAPVIAAAAAFVVFIQARDKVTQPMVVERSAPAAAAEPAKPEAPPAEGWTKGGDLKTADDGRMAGEKAEAKPPADKPAPTRGRGHAGKDAPTVTFKAPSSQPGMLGKVTRTPAPAKPKADTRDEGGLDSLLGSSGAGQKRFDAPQKAPATTPAPAPAPPPAGNQGPYISKEQFDKPMNYRSGAEASQHATGAPSTPAQLQNQYAPEKRKAAKKSAKNEEQVAQERPMPQAASPQPIAGSVDDVRQQSESIVSTRENSARLATSPEQLYSLLVQQSNDGNCAKVVDLVKQLETWSYGQRSPGNMQNAYLLRARCQNDSSLAQKDYDNAKKMGVEAAKRSKAKKAAPAKAAEPTEAK